MEARSTKWLKTIGVERPLLRWQEPHAVTQMEWRRGGWSECKELFWALFKAGIFAGVPLCLVAKIWLPQGFAQGVFATLFFSLIFPALMCLALWFNSKTGTMCAIKRRGLVTASGQNILFCKWEEIITHEFRDFSDVPGVRMLSVTVRSGKGEFEREFRFDPAEVSESEIKRRLEAHLAQ